MHGNYETRFGGMYTYGSAFPLLVCATFLPLIIHRCRRGSCDFVVFGLLSRAEEVATLNLAANAGIIAGVALFALSTVFTVDLVSRHHYHRQAGLRLLTVYYEEGVCYGWFCSHPARSSR